MQNYIIENWKQTPFCKEWEIYKSPFPTKTIGTIDILAKHRERENSWHIIEIKKEKASIDKVIGQILRYMGWVKKHKTDFMGVRFHWGSGLAFCLYSCKRNLC